MGLEVGEGVKVAGIGLEVGEGDCVGVIVAVLWTAEGWGAVTVGVTEGWISGKDMVPQETSSSRMKITRK